MICRKTVRSLVGASLLLTLASAHATTLFSENFNSFTAGNFNATQAGTGYAVAFGGSVSGWIASGGNAVHAVDLGGQNYSAMIYSNNVLTLGSGIAGSNTSGQSYLVNFLASAAAYSDANGGTQSFDGLVVDVLRANNSVLASTTFQPGAWANVMAFSNVNFQYTGDGSGDIRLRVRALIGNDVYFGGAIDNLTLSSNPAPEPASLALLGLGVAGLAARRRKLRQA